MVYMMASPLTRLVSGLVVELLLHHGQATKLLGRQLAESCMGVLLRLHRKRE
jgi:hypothetical protein